MIPNRVPALIFALIVLFFCYQMALIMVPYLEPDPQTTFLRLRTEQINWPVYRWPLYAHIFPALLILATGATQFSLVFMRRFTGAHRRIGQVYVYLTLGFSGPAAIFMAFYANGGLMTKAAFICQGVLWWLFTYFAWRSIQKGAVRDHGIWMVRSYALCTAAITLRLMQRYLLLDGRLLPADSYQLVAWPSWLINLALAELILAVWQHYRKPSGL